MDYNFDMHSSGRPVGFGARRMQSTGMVDKDGREIFEGDILENTSKFGWPDRLVVKWTVCDPKDVNLYATSGYDFGQPHGWIVVGNIYENPDLVPK
jgi:hypothetical protein